jgi:hypothetical protein
MKNWTTLFLVGIFLLTALVTAEPTYDKPETLRASDILPPNLLTGPNHKVEDKVTNDGYLNTYTLDSRWGTLEVVSTPLLKKRIKELDAMAQMEKLKGTDEFKSGVEKTLDGIAAGGKKIVTDPGGSVKAVGKGIGGLFKSIGGVFKDDKQKHGETEGSTLERVSGFSKVERQYAKEFGVDTYSRNELLQKELSDISKAGFLGSKITSMGLGSVGALGKAVSVVGTVDNLTSLVYSSSPKTLRQYCRTQLDQIGVDKDVIDLFLNNTNFTITEQTAIVTALIGLENVQDRSDFVKFAVLTDSAELATFRAIQAHLYGVYSEKSQKLARFVHFGHFSCAQAVDGALVVVAPVDKLLWTRETAEHITALNAAILGENPKARRILWITGTFTPLAESQLKELGWSLRAKALEK